MQYMKLVFGSALLSFMCAGCGNPFILPEENIVDPVSIEVQDEEVIEVELLLSREEILQKLSTVEDFYLPIFMFHYIENIPENTSDQIRYTLSFSPEKLESFLQFFAEEGITTLTFLDIVEHMKTNSPLPEKAVILTFDDGHNDHYSDAFRLLEQYDMKGVFYVITEKPDNDSEYMTWSQIREISEAGHEIGSHSATHADLRNVSATGLEKEIISSKNTLEEKISQEIVSFCYPAGKYSEAAKALVSQNYLFGRTTAAGKTLHFTEEKRSLLPTVRIFPTTGLASLNIWFE